jgi:hypothetical protein
VDVLIGGSRWPRSRQGTRGDSSMANVLVVAAGRGTLCQPRNPWLATQILSVISCLMNQTTVCHRIDAGRSLFYHSD